MVDLKAPNKKTGTVNRGRVSKLKPRAKSLKKLGYFPLKFVLSLLLYPYSEFLKLSKHVVKL